MLFAVADALFVARSDLVCVGFFLGEFWFVQWKDPPPEEVQLVVGWLVQFGLCGCSFSGDWFSFDFFFVLLESSDSKWEKFR